MKNRINPQPRFGSESVATPVHLAVRFACLWPTLGLLAALDFGALPAQGAAVTEAWVHRYNNVVSNSSDLALKVVRDAAGDIIVTGTTDDGTARLDMLTIKYSGADGTMLWQQRYNGPANSYDQDDQAIALAVDGSGNVVVTGSSYGTNFNADYYTAKYASADGALLWEQRYNGPANNDDQARSVAVDGSGNVVVTGSSIGTEGGANYYTAKYATADGALLWEKRYRGPGNHDDAAAVTLDGGGNVIVTGSSYNTNSIDYYTAKYAVADGALLWERRSHGPPNGHDSANALAVDGSGNVVVTGSSGEMFNGDYYTAKYAAADGALLWEKRYNGPAASNDRATALAVDGSGNVVVTGTSGNGTNGYSDYYTAKYAAADGALLWEKRYNGSAYSQDFANAVAVDSSDNVVVTGASDSDYYTAKYAAADGALLWEKRYDGPANGQDSANAVAVDSSGNVVVTGYSGANNFDYYTANYAAADGALLWEQRYNGLANREDIAQAVAVDSSGNVVVTGISDNGTNTDYYTAKYAAANGALLWEQRYNGPGNSHDQVTALAVDGAGNVVVTGYSDSGFYPFDYCTAKYAAADGALLWEQHSTGGGSAVAVDGAGNVVVTGYAHNGSPLYDADYYTAKYASADGALLWERRYNGPVNNDDRARAVAVDSSGNVVVTGYSYGTNFNADYYTAKYAAVDGALLWEQRYDGPASNYFYDGAAAVALDSNDNVVVTGGTQVPFVCAGCSTYYTAKYAAADGALLWEQRGPANGYDGATALAVDGNGNVVVTGSSGGTNFTADYYTIEYYTAKYASADGALLWEQRYSGLPNRHDSGAAVAVDGGGNVVVTGYSHGTNFDADYYTAKYAAADGTLLWEQRYNGPANGDDTPNGPRSLALGPNGMIVVTGSSSGDYATVVYLENQPPVIICPSNVVTAAGGSTGIVVNFTVTATDDSGVPPTITCTPPSGSVLPIGQTTVTCTATDGDNSSNTCSFNVTVLGARGIKSNLLAGLIAVRPTVTDRNDGRELDSAINHLTKSLAANLWVDETHVNRKHGNQVFYQEKLVARKLCSLLERHIPLPFVPHNFPNEADRLLAVVAIEDAIAAGVSSKKIEQAQGFLARGDAAAVDDKCSNGIGDYRKAWKRVTR